MYTGVGKVNAAITLMAALRETKPDLLINYGIAGAIRTDLAHIVEVGQSVQCDLDVRPLSFALAPYLLKPELNTSLCQKAL